MGILNDIADGIGAFFETIDNIADFILTAEIDGQQPSQIVGRFIDDINPAGEMTGFIVDTVEESILGEYEDAGQITPSNVEGVQDAVEGEATAWLGGAAVSASSLEALSFGQVEAPSDFLGAALDGLGVGDVMGREIDAHLQEGVDPALKQKVHRNHRSKQANIQDFVNVNRDMKWASGSIDTREGDIPGDVRSLFSETDFDWLPDPDTYGTIPDQTGLYEFTSLESLEPEELIEEAPQKGVVPSRAAMEQVLHVSGLPEDVKEVYLEVWDNLPETAGMIEDSLRLQNVIFEIDTLVIDNVMSPNQAIAHVRSDVENFIEVSFADGSAGVEDRSADEVAAITLDNLYRHWQLLWRLPNGAPSQTDIEEWYEQGQISLGQFRELFAAFGSMRQFWGNAARAVVINQSADEVRDAQLLDRITSQEAMFRLRTQGWTDQQASAILAGADPASLLEEEATDQQNVGELPASSLDGISSSDQAVLSQLGLGTVQDIADASVSDLTDSGVVGERIATQVIPQAQRLLEVAN